MVLVYQTASKKEHREKRSKNGFLGTVRRGEERIMEINGTFRRLTKQQSRITSSKHNARETLDII